MKKHIARGLFAILLLAAGEKAAQAQANPQPGQNGSLPASNNAMLNMYGNSAMNPYLNPYLNQAMSGSPTTQNNALLYLWSAQQMPGGLMAPRPSSTPTARAPEVKRLGTPPGGGAAKFFNRGKPGNDGSSHYYSRTNRYFGNNGR